MGKNNITAQMERSVDRVRIGRNNKRKGAQRELIVKGQLEAQGWSANKAGGSFGPFDLICIHPDVNVCLCIQVKSNKPPGPKERDEIMSFQVPSYVIKLVWIVKDRQLKKPDIYHYGDLNIYQVPYEYYLKQGGKDE